MKRIIPIALIICVVGILAYSYLGDDKGLEKEVVKEEENTDSGLGEALIIEDPRLTSVYELKGKKEILEFLDPNEMNNYEDLITLYITFLLKSISDKPSEFYEVNYQGISDYLGIYDLNDFLELNNYLVKEGITKDSKVKEVELAELKQEGNLLHSKVRISLDDGNITVSHYINYVYINQMDYLFLYSGTLI